MAQNLARRMRPRNIDEIVGQKHLVGKGKIIRRMVETQLFLWNYDSPVPSHNQLQDSQCHP